MLSSELQKISLSYLPLSDAAPLPIIYLITWIWTHSLTWDLHLIVSIQNLYVKTIYNMSVFEAEFFEEIIMKRKAAKDLPQNNFFDNHSDD